MWYLTAVILQKQHLISIHPQRRHWLQPSGTVAVKTRMALSFFPGRLGPSVNKTSIQAFLRSPSCQSPLLFAFSLKWRAALAPLPASFLLPQFLLLKITPPDLPTVSTSILLLSDFLKTFSSVPMAWITTIPSQHHRIGAGSPERSCLSPDPASASAQWCSPTAEWAPVVLRGSSGNPVQLYLILTAHLASPWVHCLEASSSHYTPWSAFLTSESGPVRGYRKHVWLLCSFSIKAGIEHS